ncbi:MAG: large exoprotein involved in heme utilization or adhesion [Microvirga sp.]|nr:large exoprotein involved in heme utilization or adhesion [Microvirga sp.]
MPPKPWLGLALIAGSLAPTSAVAQGTRFDGTWSVEVVTEKGACDRAYRYSVIVQNGRARYGGPENFDIRGQVRTNGSVSASISRGQDRANVTGRLSGKFGTGTWTTSGGRVCSGDWNAEKRS